MAPRAKSRRSKSTSPRRVSRLRAPTPAQAAQAYLAAIVESSNEAIVSKTLDGIITSWNRAAERLYGYSADEVIGKPISIIMPKERRNEFLSILERIKQGERIELYNTVRMRKDGQHIEVEVTISPVVDLKGKIIGASAITRDISDRKKIENDLHQSHSILRSVVEGTTDRIYVKDLQGKYVLINRAGASWTNQSPADILGKTDSELFPEDLAAQAVANDRRVLASGEPESIEQAIKIDGKTRIFHTVRVPYRGPNDKIIGIIGITREMTEQRRAEQALHERDERYRRILETANDGIWLVDKETRTLYVNQRMADMLGWRAEELIGRSLTEFVFEDDIPAAQEHIEQNYRGVTEQYDFRFRRKDGSEVVVLAGTSPVMNLEGEVVGALGMFSDITDRKRAEAEMLKQAALLDLSRDAILVRDFDDRITYWNHGAEALYGWTAAEALGQETNSLFYTEFPEPFQIFEAKLYGEGEWMGDLVHTLKNGRRIVVASRQLVQRNERGEPIAILETNTDITDRKRAEEDRDFIIKAGGLLAGSLDYEETLKRLGSLVVPRLADWYSVHLVEKNGKVKEVLLDHFDPAKVQYVRELQQKYPPNENASGGVNRVIQTGEPELVHEVTEEMLVAAVRDPEQLQILRDLGLKSYMIVPLIARGHTLGTISLVTAESGRLYTEDDLTLAQALANRAALSVDNARLFQGSQALNQELEERVLERTSQLAGEVTERIQAEEAVGALLRISEKLSSTLDLRILLDDLVQEAVQLVNAESGCAGLRNGEVMSCEKYYHLTEFVPLNYRWETGRGLPGWLLEHKIPYLTNDAANDSQIEYELWKNFDVESVLSTPILDAQGQVMGFFELHNKRDRKGFNAGDQEKLLSVAHAAALAIQNAQAYQQLSTAEAKLQASYLRLRALATRLQAVREEERTRIARELHDELGQALTALKFDVTWIRNRLPGESPVREKTDLMLKLIEKTIGTVRQLSSELRPGMLDDLGLAEAIEWQAQEFQSRTGIKTNVTLTDEDFSLTQAQSTALFRIFQETLTNVARHADATDVDVKLDLDEQELLLYVKDNGRGITSDDLLSARSLGLLGMRERALAVGGDVDINGAPGKGTTVVVKIPLTENEGEAASR